jgi:hypothetical protein
MVHNEEREWENRFWRLLEGAFPSLAEACAAFGAGDGSARVSFAQFCAALDAAEPWCEEWPVLPQQGRARGHVFGSICSQSMPSAHASRGEGCGFSEGDMLRAQSSWRKRSATLIVSALDSAIVIPEPDALAKCNDVRLPHQFIKRDDAATVPGKNSKWYYPQPSMEMEARRVLDFWRGLASRPWGSKQEAAQHFRKAFAFFDSMGSGRINYQSFKAGLVRLRYGLSESLMRQLFDSLDRKGSGLVTFADMAAPLFQPQGGWQPWDEKALPKAWLRHSRLTAFDTSRLAMRIHIINRRVHERGDNIHDGVQHGPHCRLPCCSSNRDASAVFNDKGGHPIMEGYFGPAVHATWSALSEHSRGESNKFVSPPFRKFDVPVPGLFECVLPRQISSEGPHAHLAPVNNYVSGEYEPWQAPAVRLTKQYLCKVCLGAGAVTIEGFDLRTTLALNALERKRARDLDYAHPERQEICPQCHGTGWERDTDHVCVGHPPCRNHVTKCALRITQNEPSLWQDLNAADRRQVRAAQPKLHITLDYYFTTLISLPYYTTDSTISLLTTQQVRAAQPQLHITVVQARNLPVRDRWRSSVWRGSGMPSNCRPLFAPI